MDEEKPVNKCICGDITFAELKAAGVTSLESAQELGASVQCGLCRHYLLRMLETGETSFDVWEGPPSLS